MATTLPGARIDTDDYCAPCFKGAPGREQAWKDGRVRALTKEQGWTPRRRRTCHSCGARFLARIIS